MSARRLRLPQSLSSDHLAEFGTIFARAALAGFAVFLLALASHGA